MDCRIDVEPILKKFQTMLISFLIDWKISIIERDLNIIFVKLSALLIGDEHCAAAIIPVKCKE
ncbi:MAG: hypothetical protein ACOX1I_09850 [Dethiobacteria bacterium]